MSSEKILSGRTAVACFELNRAAGRFIGFNAQSLDEVRTALRFMETVPETALEPSNIEKILASKEKEHLSFADAFKQMTAAAMAAGQSVDATEQLRDVHVTQRRFKGGNGRSYKETHTREVIDTWHVVRDSDSDDDLPLDYSYTERSGSLVQGGTSFAYAVSGGDDGTILGAARFEDGATGTIAQRIVTEDSSELEIVERPLPKAPSIGQPNPNRRRKMCKHGDQCHGSNGGCYFVHPKQVRDVRCRFESKCRDLREGHCYYFHTMEEQFAALGVVEDRKQSALPAAPLHTEDQCTICLEPARSGSDPCAVLQCGHAYHETCIVKWMPVHGPCTCPICRCTIDRTAIEIIPAAEAGIHDTIYDGIFVEPGIFYSEHVETGTYTFHSAQDLVTKKVPMEARPVNCGSRNDGEFDQCLYNALSALPIVEGEPEATNTGNLTDVKEVRVPPRRVDAVKKACLQRLAVCSASNPGDYVGSQQGDSAIIAAFVQVFTYTVVVVSPEMETVQSYVPGAGRIPGDILYLLYKNNHYQRLFRAMTLW